MSNKKEKKEDMTEKELANYYLSVGKKDKQGNVVYPMFVLDDLTNLLETVVKQSDEIDSLKKMTDDIGIAIGLHARRTLQGK